MRKNNCFIRRMEAEPRLHRRLFEDATQRVRYKKGGDIRAITSRRKARTANNGLYVMRAKVPAEKLVLLSRQSYALTFVEKNKHKIITLAYVSAKPKGKCLETPHYE